MASVFERNGHWFLRVKDDAGRWKKVFSSARSKAEARRMADELERKYERQRLGLEERPAEDGGGTFKALVEWWLKEFSTRSPHHRSNEWTVNKHLLGSELATLPLVAVTPARIEAF